MPHSTLPILIVTGLRLEARLVAGPGMVPICSGGSPAQLRLLLSELAPRFQTVVSFGLAAGLCRTLSPGDVVLASGVVTRNERWHAHPDILLTWAERLSAKGQPIAVAEFVGLDTPLLDPVGKAAAHAATGAAAGDMESHIAAAYAASHGMPFAGLRAICDPVHDGLPNFVTEALAMNGSVDMASIVHGIVRQPRQAAMLLRLARNAAAAFSSLRRCRALLGPDLALADARQPFSNVP